MTTVRKSHKDLSLVKSDLKRFDAMRDEDIDYSDIPELDDHFWKNAKLVDWKADRIAAKRAEEMASGSVSPLSHDDVFGHALKEPANAKDR